MDPHHRSTLYACYLANFFLAIGSCFAILFVPLRELYGLSFTDLGLLVSLNFVTQVASDILFSKPVEKFGFRPFAVASPLITALGLGLFALSPILFPSAPFAGFCLGTFVYAVAGGLQELLLSPILDALPIPPERKARSMSAMHSFFSWGQIFVVLVTTGLLALWGNGAWQWVLVLWMIPPILSALLFCRVPLAQKNEGHAPTSLRELFQDSTFYLLLAAIALGGASEVTMGQWVSAFLEKSLHLTKLVGDVFGVCFFAFTLALGRTLYGAFGGRVSLYRVLLWGSGCAAAGYLLCALSDRPLVGFFACGLTGFCVSLLWPGTVIVASERLPKAGAAMFALLSAAGDVGASAGSFVVGRTADTVKLSHMVFLGASGDAAALRVALLLAALFPLVCCIVHFVLHHHHPKQADLKTAHLDDSRKS